MRHDEVVTYSGSIFFFIHAGSEILSINFSSFKVHTIETYLSTGTRYFDH